MDQIKKRNPRAAASDLQPIASLESLSPASNQSRVNPFGSNNSQTKQVQQMTNQRTQHVLIIDGAYFQIGLKDLNFSVDTPSAFHALLRLFEQIAGHQFDQIRFVTSEDHETYAKNARFYEEVLKKTHRQVMLDIRQYKQKSAKCRCGCKEEIKWKVQAEVDVAIAVYLIDYALCSYIDSITLFAGDRDFIDSIRYAQQRLSMKVMIMGFENNAGQPLLQSGMFVDVMQQIILLQKERANLAKQSAMIAKGGVATSSQKQLVPQAKRPPTPDNNINNPEIVGLKANKDEVSEVKVSKKVYKGTEDHWWATDHKIKEILKIKLPEKLTQVQGTFFKDESFPEETLKLLMRHPLITLFEAEHAIYTTDMVSDIEELLKFIFNTHDLLTGTYTLEEVSTESD